MAGIIGGAAGIVSNVIGGIVGANAGAGDRNAGTDAVNDAYQRLAAVGLPPDEAKAIIYNQFKQAGILTPQLEQTITQHPSLMADVNGNDQAQKAQLQALQLIQQRGQTGLNPEDIAALNQIRQQVASDTNAKQQAIMQQFQARGEGGSGAQLIAQLQGAQSGANQEANSGNEVAANASRNALQAIGAAGTLGGQIQQQQFGEQAQKAQAQDVINQFNTQNQVQQQARNVGAQNQAQGFNLQNAQQLSNANTQQANQELLRQNQAQRQQYLDTLNRASTINAAANGYAKSMDSAGSAAGQAAAAPWQAVGSAATSVGGMNFGGASGGGGSSNTMDMGKGGQDYFMANGQGSAGHFDGGIIHKYSDGTPDTTNHYMTTDYRDGGPVGGRAEVPGDDPRNDTVHAMLSPGEMVIPRTLAKSNFGKKLAKLLELHHEVMTHNKHGDPSNE